MKFNLPTKLTFLRIGLALLIMILLYIYIWGLFRTFHIEDDVISEWRWFYLFLSNLGVFYFLSEF